MKIHFALFALFALCSASAFAGSEDHAPAAMPKEFETIKQLIGNWEGMNKMGPKEEMMTVSYELTSGGTAIAERLGPGTPHEMLTVYHKEGKSLGVTHFCAMGNSPQMHMKKSDAKMVAFEMTKAEGVSSMKENHMHAVTLKMPDANTLTQEWVNMDGGKKEIVTFNFKRKK
jgi:hypothetical protein